MRLILACSILVLVLCTTVSAWAEGTTHEEDSPFYMRLSLGTAYQFARDVDADQTPHHYDRMKAVAGAASVTIGYQMSAPLVLQADFFGTLVLPSTTIEPGISAGATADSVPDVQPVRFVALGLGATWYPAGSGFWISFSAGPLLGVVGTETDGYGITKSPGVGTHIAIGYEWSPWDVLGMGLAADYMFAYDRDDLEPVANDMHFDAHAVGLHLTLVPRL
ncbi:MAG: hypothetical protein AAFX99_20055 [Myxococcota bacterium]